MSQIQQTAVCKELKQLTFKVSTPKGWLYDVVLLDLKDYELDLSGGRFSNFALVHQEFSTTDLVVTGYMTYFTDRVNWIHDHVSGKWSFDMRMQNVHQGQTRWSFSDKSEALVFKLSF